MLQYTPNKRKTYRSKVITRNNGISQHNSPAINDDRKGASTPTIVEQRQFTAAQQSASNHKKWANSTILWSDGVLSRSFVRSASTEVHEKGADGGGGRGEHSHNLNREKHNPIALIIVMVDI
jgi:hypothetical protein